MNPTQQVRPTRTIQVKILDGVARNEMRGLSYSLITNDSDHAGANAAD